MVAPITRAGDLLASSTDPAIVGLATFVSEVLWRKLTDVGYFCITHQPGLTHFQLVFYGEAPHECIYGYLYQQSIDEWKVYQWNRHWRKRELF